MVVTAEAPAVQLNSSDISAVVNATTVRELPLNGRSWTDLGNLQPGVNRIQTQPDFSRAPTEGIAVLGSSLRFLARGRSRTTTVWMASA